MLEHDGIDISEGIDTNKISGLPESIIVITSVSQHKFQIAVKKKKKMRWAPFTDTTHLPQLYKDTMSALVTLN